MRSDPAGSPDTQSPRLPVDLRLMEADLVLLPALAPLRQLHDPVGLLLQHPAEVPLSKAAAGTQRRIQRLASRGSSWEHLVQFGPLLV